MFLQQFIKDVDARISKEPGLLRNSSNEQRRHLGASIIGKKCLRAAYYSFRWFTFPTFEGRMLRLFQRGQDEEARLIEVLAIGGVVVQPVNPATGAQWRFSGYKGHYGGSLDGIATGLVGLEAYGVTPASRLLTEFKTHGDKSFKSLIATGTVAKAKPEHYTQMQIYIQEFQLDAGLYCAVNKNDDNLWIELVAKNPAQAIIAERMAESVVDARQPPPRLPYASPSNFDCRFCDQRPVCLMGAIPLKNCRTCISSVAIDGGNWYCERWQKQIPRDAEEHGCDAWTPIGG